MNFFLLGLLLAYRFSFISFPFCLISIALKFLLYWGFLLLYFLPYFSWIFFSFFYSLSVATAFLTRTGLPNSSVPFSLLMASFIYYLLEKWTYPIPIPLLVCLLLMTLTETILPIEVKWFLNSCYLISCDRFPTNMVDSVSLSFYTHEDTLMVNYLKV